MTSARAKIFLVITNLVSVACLIWVLHDADLGNLGKEISQMKLGWVIFAAVTDILVYGIQGWRWSILLTPVSQIPVFRSIRAIYVGLFANEILPFRTGEVIRCYLQSRWGNLPISVTLSSALIERIFDGIWLVVYLGIIVQLVQVPTIVQNGGYVLMLFIVILSSVLGWLMFYKKQAASVTASSRWAKHLSVLIEDLHAIGNSRSFYFAWLASLPHLLSMTLPIYGVAKAFGIDNLTLLDAAVINVIVRLGTVIPSAPGNLGTYQFLVVLAMTFLGFDASLAKRFSIILWSIVTLPLLLAGFVALSVTGFKIRELQSEAQKKSTSNNSVSSV